MAEALKHGLAQDAAAQPKTAASGKKGAKNPERRQAALLPPVAGRLREEGNRDARAGRGSGAEASGREQNVTPKTRTEAGRELIPGRPDPLTSSPDPGDDETVAIPLSTAEKCVFAFENCSVTGKIYFKSVP